MQNIDHKIFQLLLAKYEAKAAYDRVIHIYTMSGSNRTSELFDSDLRVNVYVDELTCSDDFSDYSANDVVAALDRLEEQGKITIVETSTGGEIKLMPMGGK